LKSWGHHILLLVKRRSFAYSLIHPRSPTSIPKNGNLFALFHARLVEAINDRRNVESPAAIQLNGKKRIPGLRTAEWHRIVWVEVWAKKWEGGEDL
jgi:hypothetical protein